MDVTRSLRRLVRGKERDLARTAQIAAAADASRLALFGSERLQAALRGRASRDRLLVGRMRTEDGGWRWASIGRDALISRHLWVTGASGAGKSYFLIALLLQMIRRGGVRLIVVDLKGELSQLLLDVVLPALAREDDCTELVDRLRVIRPFGTYVPMLRLTAPERGVDRDIQAWALASTIEDAYGSDSGGRMRLVAVHLLALAIELGEPLTAILGWLTHPAALAGAARRSRDERLRRYATVEFPQEERSTVRAVRARLETFLSLPQMRAALEAPRCASFAEALEDGLTVVDLGNPPAGAEAVARFWSGALLGRLSRAILSRPVTDDTPPCVALFEEVQEAPGSFEQLERLLALARYKRVGIVVANQQIAQLAQRNPALPRVLLTNCTHLAMFRPNPEDARVFAGMTPNVAGESRQESEREWVRSMAELPDREFVLWSKVQPAGMVRLRSPRVDMDSLRAAARGLSEGEQERIQRGIVAFAPSDHEAPPDPPVGRDDPPSPTPVPPPRRRSRFPGLG